MGQKAVTKVLGKEIRVQGRFVRTAHVDGEKYELPDNVDELVEGVRKCGKRIDLFTFIQKLPETAPQHRYAFEWDNLAVLPVSTFDAWWTGQIDNKTRNMARKAEKKGLEFREIPCDEAFLHGLCEIYNECPVRQGKPFPHYGMTLERARQYAGTFPDRSIFIGAFFGEEMVGFIKLVTDQTRTQAYLLHILSLVRHRDKAPTNGLIMQAVKTCAERGINYLVYERFSYGKKQRDSLSFFKEANGFKRVDLPRYYVPLTPLGWISFKLGLHRKLADRLPVSLVDKLREFRKSWYSRRKLEPATEA